jgi:hypothetical protein
MFKVFLIPKQTTKVLLIITLFIFYLTAYVLMVFTIGFLAMLTSKHSFGNQLKNILTLKSETDIDVLIKSRLKAISKTFLLLLDSIKEL